MLKVKCKIGTEKVLQLLRLFFLDYIFGQKIIKFNLRLDIKAKHLRISALILSKKLILKLKNYYACKLKA